MNVTPNTIEITPNHCTTETVSCSKNNETKVTQIKLNAINGYTTDNSAF